MKKIDSPAWDHFHFARFVALFLAISLFYALWLVACWPGVLGQDSLAIMLEVDTQREFQAGKPAFWYLYSKYFYGTWKLVEIPIILQLVVCALVCARILNWMARRKFWKSFAYCFFFVALAPSVVYYASSLYSDGIYAIALAGLLFEVWRCSHNQRLDSVACAMLAITLPFALFSRPNGILNVVALLYLFWVLGKNSRIALLAIALPWCLLAVHANTTYQYRAPIGSVLPLALYETVGFLEARPMGLWERNEPRVSEKTVKALTSSGKSLEHISKYHDHYYWDPLIFFVEGPALLEISKSAKKTIVREFFTYNVWHNFPAFAASRVNIFLYSAFANGGIPGPLNAENILPQTKSASVFKAYSLPTDSFFLDWFDFSTRLRVIFWTPWLGLTLIALGCTRTVQHRRAPGAMVCSIYAMQLAAVFVFSIAGEYRYLLAFFTAPLVLLPMLSHLPTAERNV